MDILQKQDLAAASFANDNTNAAGGLAIRTDAGSTVGDAITAATPDATTAVKGLVELATVAETPTLDAVRAVTPEGFTTTLAAKTAVATTGASRVGFLQQGAGAVGRTLQDRGEDWVSVKDFGAVGDGVTDDTAAIQTVLNKGGVIFVVEGVYIVDPLIMQSNTTLILSPKTTLKAKAGYTQFQRLLTVPGGSENITIQGNHGTIQMLKADYSTGEDRHGLVIAAGSSNISVYDLTIKDTGGDGFYINGNNISLINCISDNARRNGLSIIGGAGINVVGGEYKNSSGTNPQYGIDIEPNNASEYLRGINIIGVKTSGNARGGISCVPLKTVNSVSINISDWTSIDDGMDANSGGGAAMLFALSPTHIIGGEITVENCTIHTPKTSGVHFYQWSTNCPRIKMRNVKVIDAGAVATVSNSFNLGFTKTETVTTTAPAGNFELIDCSAIDNRATPLMRVGCFIQQPFTNLTNVLISNFKQSGQTSGYTAPVVIVDNFGITDVKVTYPQEYVTAVAVTETLNRSHFGQTMTNGGQASHTINLPLASSNVGLEYLFRVTQAGGFVRIIPNAVDTIQRYGSDAGISIVAREIGDYIRLKSIGSNKWAVTEVAGQWNAFISTLPLSVKRISNGNLAAAPASGAWSLGDIVYNSVPAAGGNVGWVCTTAGTPGVWKTFGAIAV
jgi:hypothetical protein